MDKSKPATPAYQYALYLLSGQDYSAYKLRQKMRLKGYEAEEIDSTITRLEEKNYLREGEYKRLLAKRLMGKGYSDKLIKRRAEQEELEFSAEELGDIREESGRPAEDMMESLLAKKLRGKMIPIDRLERQKLRDKVTRFLLSKGYGFDEIKKAINAAFLRQEETAHHQ